MSYWDDTPSYKTTFTEGSPSHEVLIYPPKLITISSSQRYKITLTTLNAYDGQ